MCERAQGHAAAGSRTRGRTWKLRACWVPHCCSADALAACWLHTSRHVPLTSGLRAGCGVGDSACSREIRLRTCGSRGHAQQGLLRVRACLCACVHVQCAEQECSERLNAPKTGRAPRRKCTRLAQRIRARVSRLARTLSSSCSRMAFISCALSGTSLLTGRRQRERAMTR